jgi:SAM-dependent methyltransferase
MPIPIDRKAAAALSARFAEAEDLVRNEFEGLDPHRQYRNAFARLLKADPLGRVMMLGTDQRDMFVPELRRTLAEAVPPGGHVFDFGCGDGQTFSLVSDAFPDGTMVSIEDPNPEYVERYGEVIAGRSNLRPGIALVAGLDDLDDAARGAGVALPCDGTIDLGLAIQMIFFLEDLEAGLVRMYRFLRPGGVLFVVFADETEAYTGLAVRAFIEDGGETGMNDRFASITEERVRLLGPPAEGGGAILDALARACPGTVPRLETVRQPSRLYGHSLADIVSLSIITVLSGVEGVDKFEAPLRLLRDEPERADLRIEDDGPRRGMFSVTQPQRIAVIRKTLAS